MTPRPERVRFLAALRRALGRGRTPAEQHLLERAALLARAQDVGGAGTWIWYAAANRTEWSDEARRIYGLTEEEAATCDPDLFWGVVHPDDRERIERGSYEAIRAGGTYEAEHRIVRPDGEVRWVRTRSDAESGDDGNPVRQFGVVIDITESKRVEEELRETAALLARAQQVGGVGTWIWDAETNEAWWSVEARRIYGLDDDVERGDPELFWRVVHPEDREALERGPWESFLAGKVFEDEYRIVGPDGEIRWVRTRSEVECNSTGKPVRLLSVVTDVTASKRAEEELRETAAELVRAQQLGRVGSWAWYPREGRNTWSQEARRIYDLTDADADAEEAATFLDLVHPDDREELHRRSWEAFETAGEYEIEHRIVLPDGEVHWVRSQGTVERDAGGRPFRLVGAVIDITESKAAEEEQRLLAEQLRQAQKLEAVGQLAGGVAHDFNNLLTVITGNTELALATATSPIVREELYEILRSAERATELVQQLLAFSRADLAEPRVVELNDVVAGVRRMLTRLLRDDIEVHAKLVAAETSVLVDPGRIEQVLLNLAVNARDAMPAGGQLTIVTDVLGDTVTLRVSDTGAGMDEHTRERIFDPFFTTKPAGEGTGLGLSTAYGIITKVGGEIAVESAPGAGTTFTITLPRAQWREEEAGGAEPRPLVPGSGERILIVEDEDMVRAVAAEILTRAGYAIVTAENGEAALDVFEAGPAFDLVVSDLMMPKMTGLQLADELRARGHDPAIIYTSGYPQGVAGPGAAEEHAVLLTKPFSGEELTSAVRRALDGG